MKRHHRYTKRIDFCPDNFETKQKINIFRMMSVHFLLFARVSIIQHAIYPSRRKKKGYTQV